MARAKVNGKKGLKESNACYVNGCHHNDPMKKKTRPWTKAKKDKKKISI